MLNLPQFIFINGPAGSGKDTLARLIADAVPGAYIEGFAEPIRTMIYGVFFPNEGPIDYSFDLRDQEVKQRPMPFPGNPNFDPKNPGASVIFSIRQEMIAFSETYMKRRYGEAIFGKLLWARCQEQMLFSKHFVIADSGFVPEAQFIIDQVGKEECLLIHLSRAGCNYSGDSRGDIELHGVRTFDITNDGAPEEMFLELQLCLGNL